MIQPASTGIREFVETVQSYVDRVIQSGLLADPCPSIPNRGQKPAPVLVADLLQPFPEIWAKMLEQHPKLARAAALRSVLRDLEEGTILDARQLKRTLILRLCQALDMSLRHAEFQLMHGALQLFANALGSADETRFAELFKVTTGCIYSLYVGKWDAAIHVEHFLAHAAVFLAAHETSDRWTDVVSRASLSMEHWGYAPAPAAVFVHCAHNFRISCARLPESDLYYDLIKHLRRRVNAQSLKLADAFEAMTLTFGWREVSHLVRLLWADAYEAYCRYESDVVARTQDVEGEGAALAVARNRGFSSPEGIPYIKTELPLTQPGQFVLSFPGGWTIGKTSVLCKASNLRILLDCGADDAGRFSAENPDLNLIDAILISHAHQDHIRGLLPLYASTRYNGPWYATRETGQAVELTLCDSVKIYGEGNGKGMSFNESHVGLIMRHFVPVQPGEPLPLSTEVTACALPAGHVPGSCQWLVTYGGKNILFTGDFNTRPSLSVPPMEQPTEEEIRNTIALITEGTYALSAELFSNAEQAKEALLAEIAKAPTRPVLVPVLSLGRAQEVCAALSGSKYRVGVFGLAARMTQALGQNLAKNIVFENRRPEAIRRGDYDVLVASSGCLQGGPSLVFHKNRSWGELPIILTGHLFPGTPARAMAHRVPRVRFSAHTPPTEWKTYLSRYETAKKFVIHLPEWPSEDLWPSVVVPRIYAEYTVAAQNQ